MLNRRGLMGAALVGMGLAGCGEEAASEPQLGPAGDGSPPPLPESLAATLGALVDGSGSVGGVVVAARHGEPAGLFAWGDARRSPRRPVTPETLFHIGSNGKFITGVAVLQLVQAGRIALSDRLGAHVTGLPSVLAQTPIANLLHQTTGLPDYLDQVEDWSEPVSRRMIFDAVSEGRDFEPGEAWAYSNTNYFVLGWLIEAVSGMTYADYVRERVFAPAGLPFARPDASATDIAARAQGFTLNGATLSKADQMEDEMSRAADGGVLFSALDWAPWCRALATSTLMSPETTALAWQPGSLRTGRAAPYGAGVFLERCRGQALHHHTGSVPGFVSQTMAFGGSGIQVLAVCNTDEDGEPPLEDLALAIAEGLAPGSTYLTQPVMAEDARTALLRRAFRRADADLPDSLLASEIIASGGETAPSWGVRPGHVFAPVERWSATGGEMVRYRWVGDNGERGHVVVGWTEDDEVFWIY